MYVEKLFVYKRYFNLKSVKFIVQKSKKDESSIVVLHRFYKIKVKVSLELVVFQYRQDNIFL